MLEPDPAELGNKGEVERDEGQVERREEGPRVDYGGAMLGRQTESVAGWASCRNCQKVFMSAAHFQKHLIGK